MSWKIFWAHRSYVAELGGKGFSLYSLPHLLWILFCLAGAVCFAVVYRRGGEHRRDNMRKGMALFLILFEITKQCVVALTGVHKATLLPLQICSFAEYTILIDALWPENRLFKQLMAFEFMPAALIAVLVPTVTVYPPLNFYAIHQFLMHGAIGAYIVARYAAGEIRPRYAGVWLTLLITAALAGLLYPINRACNTNFMFLLSHEDNPALQLIWNLSGGAGGFAYILGLGALAILIFHLMYAFYALLRKARRAEKSGKQP